ncbi:MAG: MBL fold metallo-hydrolase [Devosia sp.]
MYSDPVGPLARYQGLQPPTIVLITHAHGDHYEQRTVDALATPTTRLVVPQVVYDGLPEAMRARASLLHNGQSADLGGFAVEALPMYNTTPDRQKYHVKSVGNGYVLTIADRRVYIAGDTEDIPEMRALKSIDLAFLPMNLPYTMTGQQAASAARAFRPKVVYPFHYTNGPEPADFRAELAGDKDIEVRLRDWYTDPVA